MERLAPGTIVLEHRVVGHLAAGRFADVYEVESPQGARRALKLIREGLPAKLKAPARLAQEGLVVAMIEHVNVVTFHGGGHFEDRLAILLELVRESDLGRLAREAGGKLPIEYAVHIVRQASEGVAAAHAVGILHRDLKPENILVTPEGLAKVADFGDAKMKRWGVETTAEQDVSSSLHAAPERVKGRAGPKSDVFSMGIVLYEVIAGVHPITPGPASAIDIVARLMERDPAPLSSAREDVPGDLSELVARALARDPAHRCSMRQLADGLAGVLDRLHAPRRAAARNLLHHHDDRFARTEPMVTGLGAHGTVPMAAVTGEPAGEVQAPAPAEARPATLPPAPVANRETLRAPERRRAGLPITVPMPEVSPPAGLVERRTTGAPVERVVAGESVPRRGLGWAVAVGVVVVGLGVLVVGWVLVGGDGPAGGGAARPAVSGTVRASASAKANPGSGPRAPSRRAPRP